MGSTNTAVTWSVDSIQNGNGTVGTISGTGNTVTYTAPVGASSHVVAATSVSDLTKSASANVSVRLSSTISSVTVSPTSLTQVVGTQRQFTATVTGTGSYNPETTWSALRGSISSTGLYTAPSTSGSDVVTAKSLQDPTKAAATSVTVSAAVSSTISSVAVSPTSSTQNVGTQKQFTATVTGTGSYNPGVSWSAQRGSITSAGLYTAPSTSGTDVVTAASQQDASKAATASIVVSSTATVTLGPLAAFPGCEGMGSGATGGRGGVVYTVNTLEDTTNPGAVPQNGPNGPTCSLRDAMLKSGPRTIVFSVGGTITLHSTLWPVPPGLTIAGHTAPGGGIQIKGDGSFGNGGSMIWINGNSIVRYLRIRPGNAPVNASYQGLTGLAVSMDTTDDVVLDHNSFEWDGNKAVAWWSENGVRRGTFSWNLVAECLAPHSTGMLIGGYNMGQANMDQSSWDGHHNVLATIDHRLPYTNLKYGRWINNFIFGYNYAMLVRGGTQFDIIGNVYDGLTSRLPALDTKNEVRWADTVEHNENNILPSGTAQIFMSNNFGPSNPQGTSDDFTTMLRIASSENSQLDDNVVDFKYKALGPTIPASLNAWPITISTLTSANDLKAILTPAAGAYRRLAPDGSWVANRDPVDARVIGYILNPATSPTGYVYTAGPYPVLSAGTAAVDTDGDGMPDIWEDAHGLNKADPLDRNIARANARGYTNLELYLSGLFPNGTPLP
ncbi:MAG: hypothetical protein Q8K67_05235 [Geothrix sp.]|nr:hypothetical protein [Geothrix sp.]